MNIDFSQQYVVNAETGEILEIDARISALSERMKSYADKKEAFETENAALIKEIEALKENIRVDILQTQKGVSHDGLTVSWRKGAVKWDTKGLSVYAKTHPEMEQFRKTGEPTVAFALQKGQLPAAEAAGL